MKWEWESMSSVSKSIMPPDNQGCLMEHQPKHKSQQKGNFCKHKSFKKIQKAVLRKNIGIVPKSTTHQPCRETLRLWQDKTKSTRPSRSLTTRTCMPMILPIPDFFLFLSVGIWLKQAPPPQAEISRWLSLQLFQEKGHRPSHRPRSPHSQFLSWKKISLKRSRFNLGASQYGRHQWTPMSFLCVQASSSFKRRRRATRRRWPTS